MMVASATTTLAMLPSLRDCESPTEVILVDSLRFGVVEPVEFFDSGRLLLFLHFTPSHLLRTMLRLIRDNHNLPLLVIDGNRTEL